MTATNLFKKYETDNKKEVNGVPIIIDGVTFICRRAGGGNRAYRAALANFSSAPEYKTALNSTDTTIGLQAEDEITMNAFADGVVVGWSDILDRDDQPLPYSREAFMDLMTACPDVWMQLRIRAHEMDTFRLKTVEEAGATVGN